MCGSTEIDGYAFASGVDFLDKASTDITTQATFLIRGAVFRSKNITRTPEGLSLNICSLGELLDMYHAHKATKIHDKVYALRGMCSDDLSIAQLEPDYSLQWNILMERLVKFILGKHVSVSSWENKETAIISAKGCILGKVSEVETNVGRGGGQTVKAIFNNTSKQQGHTRNGSAFWTLPTSVKLIQKGDIICLFQGASKPTVVRLREDYFTIIVVAANPPKDLQTDNGPVSWSELLQSVHFVREFLLVWNWRVSSGKFQDRRKYDEMMQMNSLQLDLDTGLSGQLSAATRIWHVALILGDLGEYKKEEESLRVAEEGYKRVVGKEHLIIVKSRHGLTPLSWAAGNGHGAIVQLLLTKDDVDIDVKDSKFYRTPLSWAAENGEDSIVKQLLATKKVDVNAKDKYSRTPILYAAVNRRETVVQLLLEAKANVEAKDEDGWTPLLVAVGEGHEAVVKLLLEAKADVYAKDICGWTPLWRATRSKNWDIVELLRSKEK
jgi:Ankyrin repeats (3 copies)/Ankyrin repeats (many copies)